MKGQRKEQLREPTEGKPLSEGGFVALDYVQPVPEDTGLSLHGPHSPLFLSCGHRPEQRRHCCVHTDVRVGPRAEGRGELSAGARGGSPAQLSFIQRIS